MGLCVLVCSVIQDVLHLAEEQHTDSEKIPTGLLFSKTLLLRIQLTNRKLKFYPVVKFSES